MQLVLFEPEIPPNTGNIARLCAATGTPLHLIEPLGFKLDNRYLKRAGLDYWPNVEMSVWPDWQSFAIRKTRPADERWIMTTSKKDNDVCSLHKFIFNKEDAIILGPETRGLPESIMAMSSFKIRIPMQPGGVRSINISTAAGIVLYLALANIGLPEDWE